MDSSSLVPEIVDPLHGRRDPNIPIEHENAAHRIMVWLKAQGYSNREIAERCDYTEAWVSQVTRQEWFQKRMLEEIHKFGAKGVENLLQGAAEDSILTLIDLRDNAKSETVKAACAMNLIDRYFGKPTQRVESKVQKEVTLTDTRKLDQEITTLQAQLRNLGHTSNEP